MKNSKQWDNIYKKEGKDYKYYEIIEPHEDMGRIADIFNRNKVNKIIDFGCGAGRNLIFLAEKGFYVTGIDNAPIGIKILKKELIKKGISAEIKVADFHRHLKFKNACFDAAIAVQAIQHGREYQVKKSIKELSRILKKKGVIFVTLCGRFSKSKTRYCLVKTAKKVAHNTFIPTEGNEKGLSHIIYNKKLIKEHFNKFKILNLWKDSKDYYCFLGEKK